MKLSKFIADFRDQVRAATNPRKPEQLGEVTGAYRDGIESLIPVLNEDPILAAMAFYGQIRFANPRVSHDICERGNVLAEDWPALKASIAMRPEAHPAVKTLEEAEMHHILVFAVVMNYKVNGTAAGKRQEDEEETEIETQQTEEPNE